MSKKNNPADEYADIILRDEREKIARETPTVYETDKIERVYEFHDDAVVKYEWQSFPATMRQKNTIIVSRFKPRHRQIRTN